MPLRSLLTCFDSAIHYDVLLFFFLSYAPLPVVTQQLASLLSTFFFFFNCISFSEWCLDVFFSLFS